MAHRPDDVRLHLAQLRPLRERRVVERGEEGAEVVERGVEPPCKLHSIGGVFANEAGCTSHSVLKHICSESAGRRRQPSSRATSRPRARPRCARAGRGAPPARGRSRAASRRAPRARTRPVRRRAARRPRPESRRRRCATPARVSRPRRRGRAARRRRRRGSRRAAPGSTRRRSSEASRIGRAYSRARDGDADGRQGARGADPRGGRARRWRRSARPIGLATVLVGDDPASDVYIRMKHKATLEVGIEARDLRLPEDDERARAARRSSPS